MKYQNYDRLAQQLEGINTIETIEKSLKVKRARAIYLIHKLRKRGYVKTKYASNKKRVYHVSPTYALGGTTYLEIINKHAPVPLAESEVHRIYGRKISIEETIIYAIKQKTVRYIIACLALFKEVKNWSLLYKLAKKEDLIREVAALYEVARLCVPKIPRMPQRFKTLALPKRGKQYKHIIEAFESDDFKNIENKWKVYIPLNKGDIVDYKYDKYRRTA